MCIRIISQVLTSKYILYDVPIGTIWKQDQNSLIKLYKNN